MDSGAPADGPPKTPLFAFWDNGYHGYRDFLDIPGAAGIRGIGTRLIQSGNVANFLNQTGDTDFEFRLVHLNPAEYDHNHMFELLDRARHPGLYPDEFFDEAALEQELQDLVHQRLTDARTILKKRLQTCSAAAEPPSDDDPDFLAKLGRVRDGLLMRAYLAQKMTKRDLVQKAVWWGDSLPDTIQFAMKEFSKTELFNYAAVPLSDFVRLGLMQVYGGFWVDTTVVVNSDLHGYQQMLQDSGKEVVIYFNPFYKQRTDSSALADITGGETWWISTSGPGVEILRDWFDCAKEYWLQKDPGQEIHLHPLFAKGNGVPVDVNRIPNEFRNYLWIYLCWARVVLAKPENALATVLALDAHAHTGPYAFVRNHFNQATVLEWSTKIFAGEGTKFNEWIDAMKAIKIPGVLANELGKRYGETGGMDSDQNRKNIFSYVWAKQKEA
jgi:hypothetical protein|uniref:Uncharacterized protein n=1 Tax=Eutreptiella gymnastica TaxID=73025 RepID=A0A7S4LK57_9EUGL